MTTASNLVSHSTRVIGTAANNLVALDSSAKLPAVDGSQLTGLTSLTRATVQTPTTASATFTGIPSTAKRIAIMLNGISTSSTNQPVLRVGSSSGIVTTGYNVQCGAVSTTDNITRGSVSTIGYLTFPTGASYAATNAIYGSLVLENETSNIWVGRGIFWAGSTYTTFVAGSIAVGAVLDRVAVEIANNTGTEVLDAGTVNILYE